MEVSEISFKRQWEYGKEVHCLQFYFIYCIPGKHNAEGFDALTSIEGRLLCNLQFADDIDLPRCSEEENSCWI